MLSLFLNHKYPLYLVWSFTERFVKFVTHVSFDIIQDEAILDAHQIAENLIESSFIVYTVSIYSRII